MKDYIIWLRSGECISGTADEEALKKLQDKYESSFDGKIAFEDMDGSLVVDLTKVEAIAINNQPIPNKIGFQ